MNLKDYSPIDCDIHPAPPDVAALMPFFDDYWAEQVRTRGVNIQNFELICYPATAPISGRPDWRPKNNIPGSDFAMLQRQALDGFGSRFAICNVIHGAQAILNIYMAAAFCKAINDWIAKELLDRDPRLRASIVIPWQDTGLALEEIERRAPDKRFVQILMLVMGEMPLGKRNFWPIYEAAEKHGLTIGIHAGSIYRQPPTPNGWSSFYYADYIAFGNGFDNAVLSMIVEGVFEKYPGLKVVLTELGVAWLPAFMWRADKTWRGVRTESPWVRRPPSEYVREHFRMTLQPLDAPPEPRQLEMLMEQFRSDEILLFSSDYPHWHYEGDEAFPPQLEKNLARKILVDNPLATYPRLSEKVPVTAKEAMS